MGHRSILVDEDVFATLQSMAVPLVDDANTVLRRVLQLPASPGDVPAAEFHGDSSPSNGAQSLEEPAHRYAAKRTGASRSGKAQSPKRKRGAGSRAPAGSLLPEAQYELPLLESLIELGGSAPTSDVVDRLGKKLDDRLTEGDRETLGSGEIRWRNRVQFVRLGLIKSGDMVKDSPRGVWEITDAGRQRVTEEASA
jgi:hypothetical protein